MTNILHLNNYIGEKFLIFEERTFKTELLEFKVDDNKYSIAIICLEWKRTSSLLERLSKLNISSKSFDLYIWNNDYQNKDYIIDLLENNTFNFNIFLSNSYHNYKGIARFILANLIFENKDYKYFIFLDDDVKLQKNDLNTIITEALNNNNTAISAHAYNFLDINNYWMRKKIVNLENADYGGTGLCIYPSRVFNLSFFKWFPVLTKIEKNREYPDLMEDLILSLYFKKYIGCLKGSKIIISFYDNRFGPEALQNEKNKKKIKNIYLKYLNTIYDYPKLGS